MFPTDCLKVNLSPHAYLLPPDTAKVLETVKYRRKYCLTFLVLGEPIETDFPFKLFLKEVCVLLMTVAVKLAWIVNKIDLGVKIKTLC